MQIIRTYGNEVLEEIKKQIIKFAATQTWDFSGRFNLKLTTELIHHNMGNLNNFIYFSRINKFLNDTFGIEGFYLAEITKDELFNTSVQFIRKPSLYILPKEIKK